jgi:hypothetical protein
MRKLIAVIVGLAASVAIAQHVHTPTPRPAEKPGGITKDVKRFAYFAKEGEVMAFYAPTTVRWEKRLDGLTNFSAEKTYTAGQSATCNAATFNAVGLGGGSVEYVCTRLVETITVRELEPQTTGRPYVDLSLGMAPKRGYEREILGPQVEQLIPRPGPGGEFRISCYITHMGLEDPIVSPGKEFWHHHTFAGNPNMDRYTLNPRDYTDSLCAGGNINRSAYWFPSVIDTRFGMPVMPDGVSVYYKGSPDTVPPTGLRFLAGDPMRTIPRSTSTFPVSKWECYPSTGGVITQGLHDEIPSACPVGGRIVWTVTYPDCWDGVNLDSADHKSHVHWRALNTPSMTLVPNGCPTTHPYRLFDLSINVGFTVRADDNVSRWRLSTDSYDWSQPAGYSAHADWWNGWDQAFLTAIKEVCHDGHLNCGQNNAPDGRRMGFK